MRIGNVGWIAVLATVLVAWPARATTYVMMNDGDMVETAPTILEVTIIDQSPAAAGALPMTDYQVRVDEVLKGAVPGTAIIVRVPGALNAHGLSLHIPGVPRFEVSQKALLFLTPRGDGTYGLHHLGLGAFHRRQDGATTWAVRDLEGSLVLDGTGVPVATSQTLRSYPLFQRWVQDRVAGVERVADYQVDLPAWRIQSLRDAFTFFVDPNTGLKMRWPDFDDGNAVAFFADQGGQPGLSGGGFAQFQTALGHWTADPGSNIEYRYGGTVTGKTGGLTDPCDGTSPCELTNAIVFDDPNNYIGTPFVCGSGGIIAAGGPWFDFRTPTVHTYRGQTFLSILTADVVVNKNVGCILSAGRSAEEVYTHELGHTLGIGHSCDESTSNPCDTPEKRSALMYAFSREGSRGGDLGTDDRGVAAALYTAAASLTCVAGPNSLCLQNDRFRVTADWRKPSGETGVGTAVELTADTGYFWFFNQSNVEIVVKVLNNCNGSSNRFWVFAGGLTNVEVDLVVEDTQTGAIRTYQNPLSTPFQPIQDTGAFNTCP